MRIQFTRRTEIIGNSVACNSHLKCGNRIKNGEPHWRSGNITGHLRYGICQKCFGFWLTRYNDFDYVGELDDMDREWMQFWEKEWSKRCLSAFYSYFLIIRAPLPIIVLEPQKVIIT